MIKRALKTAVYATAIAIVLALINYAIYRFTGRIIGFKYSGGECFVYQGFGLLQTEIFPLTVYEGTTAVAYSLIQFDLASYLLTVGVFFVLLSKITSGQYD